MNQLLALVDSSSNLFYLKETISLQKNNSNGGKRWKLNIITLDL
jgi:hypothetical protein